VTPEFLSERLRRPGDLLDHVQPNQGGLKEMLAEVEKWIILDALRANENNKTVTADALQISREGLHKKLARFGLK
jgi:transcriptional regulator with PAS, ATPase and Fis domain